MMAVLRILILLVWIVPMLAGALAALLVLGVRIGWDIMAEWIERIEP